MRLFTMKNKTSSAPIPTSVNTGTSLQSSAKDVNQQPACLLFTSLQFSAKDVNQQLTCPLFTIIPPEIRNKIFRFALLSYYDPNQPPYPLNEFYARPGYLRPRCIDTSLLETCRLIYLETRLVPITYNEHVVWCYRGPPNALRPEKRFELMTPEQKAAVSDVHLFTQMSYLEETANFFSKEIRPRYLKITIRQSDWWFWKDNTALQMTSVWIKPLQQLTSLEEFEMEMEVIDRDKDQVHYV
jgi:hypothetical protein